MPNTRYRNAKEREYKFWYCNGKEFPTLEAARKYKRRKNSEYDYVKYEITEVVERTITFEQTRTVK